MHRKYTGVSNKVIKKNLERLVAAKAASRAKTSSSLSITATRSKYQALGLKDAMPPKHAYPGFSITR